MQPVRFVDLMRLDAVDRWTIVNKVKRQSVAEHSFRVMVLFKELCLRIERHIDESLFDDVYEEYAAVMYALFHDAPESVYGDIPTPGKIVLKRLANDPHLFDKVDDSLMGQIPYRGAGSTLPPFHARTIKICDLMESVNWIASNGIGARAQKIAQRLKDILYDRVREWDANEPRYGVYLHVNDMMLELQEDSH